MGNRRSTITQACNNNIQRQRAWGSNPIISCTNFYKPQIKWLQTNSCDRIQLIHNHPNMKEYYRKPKSMGKQFNWIDQYREEAVDLMNRKERRCRMQSRFSSLTLHLEHEVLCNYCRSAASRVSLEAANGVMSLNHLAASRTLPRKAAARSRGRSPLVAEEVIVGS
jgi:hypothetical protein